jgi:hypothetical protein
MNKYLLILFPVDIIPLPGTDNFLKIKPNTFQMSLSFAAIESNFYGTLDNGEYHSFYDSAHRCELALANGSSFAIVSHVVCHKNKEVIV